MQQQAFKDVPVSTTVYVRTLHSARLGLTYQEDEACEAATKHELHCLEPLTVDVNMKATSKIQIKVTFLAGSLSRVPTTGARSKSLRAVCCGAEIEMMDGADRSMLARMAPHK